MTDKAILIKKKVVLVNDTLKWAKFFEMGDRILARTRLKDVVVSTVFLGIDHGFGDGHRWFETMVFGGPIDDSTQRYETYDEAMEGHQKMIDEVLNVAWHTRFWWGLKQRFKKKDQHSLINILKKRTGYVGPTGRN